MEKLIILGALLFCGLANASPYMMGQYLDGKITASEYVDRSIGYMPTHTTVYGPGGTRYEIYGR